jgi:O-antigen ligase
MLATLMPMLLIRYRRFSVRMFVVAIVASVALAARHGARQPGLHA